MNKHFPLLLLTLALSFSNIDAFSQGSATAQSPLPIGAVPDNKMLGGTSVGAGLSGIAAPDLFNGGLNVSVPIYSYMQSAFGVSLSYNTTGVKVDEFAGPVGLHWNVNCGGTIVRVTRDIFDECMGSADSLMPANSLDGGSLLIPNKEMHIYGKLFAYGESPAKLNAANAYVDHECDEFVVSVPGMSFKFYIGKNLKVFTTSAQNIQVQLLADDNPITDISQFNPLTQILNFRITDSKGNRFYFQPSRLGDGKMFDKFWDWHNLDYDTPFNVTVGDYPIKWKLKKVLLADGQSINYQYSTMFLSYGVPHLTGKSYIDYYVSERLSNGDIDLYNYGGYGNDPEIDGYPLLEIDYPGNTRVHFQYDTQHWNAEGDYFLDEIKVSSGNNCKRFRFQINQDTVNKRYFLDSIQQVSCDGTETEPYYSFTYNPVNIMNVSPPGFPPLYDREYPKLPKRLNSGQDLYGFYNGDSTGASVGAIPATISAKATVPQHHPGTTGNYGSERQYNARFARAGLLASVKNAYGNTDSFFYGANVITTIPLADSIPTDNNFIGAGQPDGVRIDSVASTDAAHPGKRLLTVFDYTGGQIFMPGGYFHYPTEIDSATGVWKESIYQSMFLTPHQLVNGANHGYSTVDVKNYADGDLLSQRLITYTNMQDASSGNQPRYYKVPGSKDYFEYPYTNKQYLKDWEIGLPLTVTDYDQNNRIVKKSIYQYTFSQPDLSASSGISNANKVEVNSGTSEFIDGFLADFYPNKKIFTDNYYPFKGMATLASTVTQKYISDTRFVTDTVWYAYDNRNNLKSTITQDSKGDKTATELVYNYDVDGPQYTSPGQQGYTSHPGTTLYNMSADGLEIPVSTERWKLRPGTTITGPYGGTVLQNNNKLLSAFITGYQYQNGKLWTKSLWNTQNGNPLDYTTYTGLGSGVVGNPYGKVLAAYNTSNPVANFIQTSQVTLFDAKGNPMETQMQRQDQYKAMIWDTATGQKLAEAANCRYSDIGYTSFEDNLSESNFTVSYTAALTTASDAITGTHILNLWKAPVYQGDPGAPVTITGKQNLKAGKPYLISFWVSVSGSNPAPTLKVGSQNISLSNQVVYTKGNWKKYLVRFTPSAAGKIMITGASASSRIDEVRLFPANAQMQSWTYGPLFGKSSQTGPSGRIIYYQYDKMGRQDLIFDMDGNILSKTDYHMAQ